MESFFFVSSVSRWKNVLCIAATWTIRMATGHLCNVLTCVPLVRHFCQFSAWLWKPQLLLKLIVLSNFDLWSHLAFIIMYIFVHTYRALLCFVCVCVCACDCDCEWLYQTNCSSSCVFAFIFSPAIGGHSWILWHALQKPNMQMHLFKAGGNKPHIWKADSSW